MRRPRIVLLCILIAVGSAFGGYVLGTHSREYVAVFDVRATKKPIGNGESLGCSALASAYLSEDRIGKMIVTARARPGTDAAALTIAADGKSLTFLTSASLKGGVSEGAPIPIVERSDAYVVAAASMALDMLVITLDLKTGNAVWSYSGLSFPGLTGESIYLRCR